MVNPRMIVGAGLAVALAVVVLAYSGAYNVAADEPHWDLTGRALATVRDRSIAARADAIVVPNLADPELISVGAEHYGAMCAGCHLAPGLADNELRQGMYPRPPDLAMSMGRDPRETFWIIKHGVKMSGMPAWGVTHDDDSIWGLVAFVHQLPTLSPAEYAASTGALPSAGAHAHGGNEPHGEPGEPPVGGVNEHAHDHAAGAGHEH